MAPNTDVATRSFVVALKSPAGGKTSKEVEEITGIQRRTIDAIYSRAVQRGFKPDLQPIVIKDEFLQDALRSGRPTKQNEALKQAISAKVCGDCYGRELSCADLTSQLSTNGSNVSVLTVWSQERIQAWIE
jgi:hypothetical protein